MNTSTPARRRPGWWYPYIFLGAFGVVLAVNLVFMSSAIGTFSGLSTEDAYNKGVKYNEQIAEAKEQQQLGWVVKAEVTPIPPSEDAHSAVITVTILDGSGHPLNGLSVAAGFVRPTTSGHDGQAVFAERGEGRYVVRQSLAFPGQWDMNVSVRRGAGEPTYQFSQRIYVP
jgi:nitrogen fixation protein FixH